MKEKIDDCESVVGDREERFAAMSVAMRRTKDDRFDRRLVKGQNSIVFTAAALVAKKIN